MKGWGFFFNNGNQKISWITEGDKIALCWQVCYNMADLLHV